MLKALTVKAAPNLYMALAAFYFFAAKSRKTGSDYFKAAVVPRDSVPLSDHSTNFFARVILENRYERVIEVGSFDGRRAVTLKALFPDIEVVGMDIQPGYGGERAGVRFVPFCLDRFAGQARTLVVSKGTLAYFPRDDLIAFLKRLKAGGCDLAYYEASNGTSVDAGNGPNRFYDYETILTGLGFSFPCRGEKDRAIEFDLRSFEHKACGYAVAGSE